MRVFKEIEIIVSVKENDIVLLENSSDVYVNVAYEVENDHMEIEIIDFVIYHWKDKNKHVVLTPKHELFRTFFDNFDYNVLENACWDDYNFNKYSGGY